VGLLAWMLWPFAVHAFRFPLGPDAPVYLWWARLARVDGLTAIDPRVGAPALAIVLEGALGRSVVEVVAALEAALGVSVGLASAALVLRRTTRTGWVLAGALAGTFAVHLAAGYLANLLQVAAFLAAAVALAEGTRRASWVAAGLLGASGLAHQPFFMVAAAILLLAAAMAWRQDRAEALQVGGAVAAGGALVGLGLLAQVGGIPAADVDTSRDAILRRAGLTSELRSAFVDRFVHRWARYVQWVSVPLAALGVGRVRGFVGRFLGAWALATVLGAGVALATGWFPADRFVTFGFAVPILAALGLVWLLERLRDRRVVGLVATAVLTVVMLAGAFIAWNRQEPFLSEEEVGAATIAGEAASELDAGVPLAFLVNEADETVSFLAARAGNVIRAAVPPDRIRDVVIVVPPGEGAKGGTERRAVERLSAADLRDAEATSGRPATVFVLTPFNDIDRPNGARVVGSAPARSSDPSFEPLEPWSGGVIALSSLLVLAFVSVVGYGWARISTDDAVRAAAIAPAGGAAALVLVAVALDRTGVRIGDAAGAWGVSALAGGSGYLVWGILERRSRSRPTPQVEKEPP
jgi:hypothetical protein